MAAKAKASAHPKKGAAPKVTHSARSKPKGLHYTAAQRKAYSAAFAAEAHRLSQAAALRNRANGLRRYRLQSAAAHVKKYNTVHLQAQAASVAAFATSRSLAQSIAGHQQAALRHRIGLNAYHHTTLLGRIQFAEGGQKRYAQRAVLRTLTQAQAVSYERKLMSKVIKNAKRAVRRKSSAKRSGTHLSKAITAAATRAGMAAAARVPRTSVRASPASARASAASRKHPSKTAKSRTAPLTYGQAAAAAAHAAAAFTGYAAVNSTPKVISGKGEPAWVGNEYTPDCIVAAIANHLLRVKKMEVSEKAIAELTELAGPEPKIEEVLWQVWMTGWPGAAKQSGYDRRVRLANYKPADPDTEFPVIGYEVQTDDGPGDHCALALGDGKVVSWGSVRERESPVEEAWELTWQMLMPVASRYSWRLRQL